MNSTQISIKFPRLMEDLVGHGKLNCIKVGENEYETSKVIDVNRVELDSGKHVHCFEK